MRSYRKEKPFFAFVLSFFDAMSGSKLPLTAENVMAEKDKVAEALLRGESYDPFGVADMFEPADAAEAFNAVVQNAPSVSASSQVDAGLEMQPGVELEKTSNKEAQKDEAPSPKSSEPDWEMADPIPVTEAEMVGDLIKDQEEEDKAQFVFLSEADADMETVTDKLDDLTKHIQWQWSQLVMASSS